MMLYLLRVYYLNGWYLLNLCLGFLSPQVSVFVGLCSFYWEASCYQPVRMKAEKTNGMMCEP